jgi:antitoxin (DNA-binding transcriptional repressor) of toxin-antitoxin stability system
MTTEMEPEEISITELRRDFPTIVSRMQVLGVSYRIMKNGRQFALLSPLNDGGTRVEAARKQLRDRPDELVPGEEVMGAGTTT